MALPKIVAIGGGSGLSSLLHGLKDFPVDLSGLVTMTDNGASSGRLCRELGILPPGDVRKCLAALASDEQLMTKLFEYRFRKGRGLNGHSLGNLLLLALTEITGDFESAVRASSSILAVKGEVVPSTLSHVSLVAELKNGQQALGEKEIPIQGHRFGIKKIHLIPEGVRANPRALEFVRRADLLIFGPGSLYTSLVPNLLIGEMRKTIERSGAPKYYVCNVSTERGETEGYSVEDHVAVITRHLGKARLDGVIVNNRSLVRSNTGKLGSICNILTKARSFQEIPFIKADVIDRSRPLYHDPRRLSRVIWKIFSGAKVSPRRLSE